MAALPDTRSKDKALLLCRVGFLVVVVFFAFTWAQITADQRFYVILFAIAGSIVLATSGSFHALCSKLLYFGWIIVGFALFTLLTGYRFGWKTARVVEDASAIVPLTVGLLIVIVSLCAKRFVRTG